MWSDSLIAGTGDLAPTPNTSLSVIMAKFRAAGYPLPNSEESLSLGRRRDSSLGDEASGGQSLGGDVDPLIHELAL